MVKRKIRLGDVWCSAEKVLEVTVGCKLSMVKESEMAGLNDSDLRILRFLGKFRFVPTRVIETECFPAQSAKSAQAWTSRCLKKLRDNGLVERVQAFGGVWVHFLTECGSSLIGAAFKFIIDFSRCVQSLFKVIGSTKRRRPVLPI